MSRRGLVGFAAAACVACCAGPFLAAVGGIAALGAVGTFAFGVAALASAVLTVTVLVVIRRRLRTGATTHPAPPHVELGHTNRWLKQREPPLGTSPEVPVRPTVSSAT